MPLFKGPSKKNFKHNVGVEMKSGKPKDQSLAIAYAVQRQHKGPKKMASGGMVDDSPMPSHDHEDHYESIADAILKKKKLADGRDEMLAANATEHSNYYDELNMDIADEPTDAEMEMLSTSQPKDSNEHGRDIDSDKHDMISKIRSKIKSKRG